MSFQKLSLFFCNLFLNLSVKKLFHALNSFCEFLFSFLFIRDKSQIFYSNQISKSVIKSHLCHSVNNIQTQSLNHNLMLSFCVLSGSLCFFCLSSFFLRHFLKSGFLFLILFPFLLCGGNSLICQLFIFSRYFCLYFCPDLFLSFNSPGACLTVFLSASIGSSGLFLCRSLYSSCCSFCFVHCIKSSFL